MRRLLAFPIALLSLVTACGVDDARSRSGADVRSAAKRSTSAPGGNPCERKLVGEADVAGIMTSSVVKMEALAGDPQSCVFSSALQAHITVMVRPGLGNVTVWEKWDRPAPPRPRTDAPRRPVQYDLLEIVTAVGDEP